MRSEPCPDCGVVLQPHAPGCVTKAVEDGQLTPRERQVMIVERRMALGIEEAQIPARGSFSSGFREAVRLAGARGGFRVRDTVIRANPGDVVRLAEDLTAPGSGAYRSGGTAAGTPEAPLRIEGYKILQDNFVAPGTVIAVPANVHDLLSRAGAGPDSNVRVGFDPATADAKPVFYMEPLTANGARFSVITGLAS